MLELLREGRSPNPTTTQFARDGGRAVSVTDRCHLLLKRVLEGHYLLHLTFAPDSAAYQTALLDLVPEQGYLVLDALTPNDALIDPNSEPRIYLRTRMKGLELRFHSHITQAGTGNAGAFYKVRYPDDIEYAQRRDEHRVTVPLDKGVPVKLHERDGTIVRGEVRDLSPGGFSARLMASDIQRLTQVGPPGVVCEITLPTGKTVTACVEICHLYPSEAGTMPKIGACFVDLDARAERQIERCVALLEREQTRRR